MPGGRRRGRVAAQDPASEVVTSLLNDPARALELASQEARNVFRRTPEGLETPAFRVPARATASRSASTRSFALAVADATPSARRAARRASPSPAAARSPR